VEKRKVEIIDVTARDGLQNESTLFSTEEKLELISQAIKAGARRLEVASFAHPKYVPQMADAEAVIAGLPKRSDAKFIGLVMNDRGMDRALKTDIEEVGLVCVASDTFAQKNQGQTRDGSVDMACNIIRRAQDEGRMANVTIAASLGCPFEGEIATSVVVEMAKKLAQAGPHEISLADTIGVGNPWHVKRLVTEVKAVIHDISLRGHFHNTRNTGLANVSAAFDAGVDSIDVSIGGIGGCPFAPAATGNVPSEDVIYMFERAGIQTGYDLDAVVATAEWLSAKMDKDLPGMVSRAGGFPQPRLVA
jgi:hydroxymethylglutaryl-CoA lyase